MQPLFRIIALLFLLPLPQTLGFKGSVLRNEPARRCRCPLYATGSSNNNKKLNTGVYVRPSAAIERGSGFFVPGLEGPKVRLAVGTVVVGLTLLNNVMSSDQVTVGNKFANGLAAFYGILVLFQAAIEFVKQDREEIVVGETTTRNLVNLQQQWTIPVEDVVWKDKVQWAASSYLSLSPATNMVLIGPGKIIYSLGSSALAKDDSDACQAALNTLSQSSGGRISLPASHPAYNLVNDARCVILQRIDDQLCWMVTSTELLAAFPKSDLLWLGQLASHVHVKV
jgi:hypothetical protein